MNTELFSTTIEESLKLTFIGVEIVKQEEVAESKDVWGFLNKKIHLYFTVPESSTLDDDDFDEDFNNQIKTSEGIINITKDIYIKMIVKLCDEDGDFITEEDVKDYIRFFAKVREGDVWNLEKAMNKIKEVQEDIKKVVEFKEV